MPGSRSITSRREKVSPTRPRCRSEWKRRPSKETTPTASWPRCCRACRPSAVIAAASGWLQMPKMPHSSLSLSSSKGLVVTAFARVWVMKRSAPQRSLIALDEAVHFLDLVRLVPLMILGAARRFGRWLRQLIKGPLGLEALPSLIFRRPHGLEAPQPDILRNELLDDAGTALDQRHGARFLDPGWELIG